jgi:hypothetical protein
MTLSKFGSDIPWEDCRNNTPTFSLTPVEKPDLSPFLIHMTGKNNLIKILRGKEAPKGIAIPTHHGYIKSSVPAFKESQSPGYDSKVVCFTESPIFALDFFRVRSHSRWRNNQQYGIGFSKHALVLSNSVRPVIYLDTNANTQLLSLCYKAERNEIAFSDDEDKNDQIREFFKNLKPLLFPLLEKKPLQGFMWEREWRYPFENGLIFSYDSIKIICCPKEERNEIEDILKPVIDKIQIVESWKEYNEIIDYLRTREKKTGNAKVHFDQINDLDMLRQLKAQSEETALALVAYHAAFKSVMVHMEHNDVKRILHDIEERVEVIRGKIEKLENGTIQK